MHPLTKLIHDDMIPALGVTEPGAIAFAAARARSLTKGPIQSVAVAMNSGLYKNAFTCGTVILRINPDFSVCNTKVFNFAVVNTAEQSISK